MAGKLTDRKAKGKEAKPTANAISAFVLPDSLPCSEIEFPVAVKKTPKANWHHILQESEQRHREIEKFAESKKEPIIKSPFLKTESDYLKNEVFAYLIPALEDTLNRAKIWDALLVQKCFFNGIDWIVQELWNSNPRYPGRIAEKLHLFNMPWVRKYLKEHPRPYYPKSWLWPEEYAATLIQTYVRQYFVQREEDVQEMRDFWRKLDVESHNPEIELNPFLAKRFASEPQFHKHH